MLGRFRRRRTSTPETTPAEGPMWPLEVWRHPSINADQPGYVPLCLTPAFTEQPETRTLRDGYGLNRIIEVAKTHGSRSPAMAEVVGELLDDPRYAALDVLYGWLVPVYEGTDRQLQVLGEGLRTCPRKYRLLESAGIAMLERRRGPDALYYWAQSVTNAESLGEGAGANGYVFLAAVARVTGQASASKRFSARADQADLPTVLDASTTQLVETAFRAPTKAMSTVVQALADRISR